MFVVPHGKRILLDLSHLKVYVPSGDYLLAMKVLSARADTMDREDMKVLIGSLHLNNVADVVDIVKSYYPNKGIKPETRILLEELLKGAQ
jgi:hypothetical protein